MSQLTQLIQEYGVLIVFGTVLLQQAGFPLPAFPVLIVAGALAMKGQANWAMFFLASILACLAADFFWFRAGRRYGKRILRLLCRISLSPDTCVAHTEDNFTRYGPSSLLMAKFIPGFGTIAPPLAGATGLRTPKFLWLSGGAAMMWSGAGLGFGAWFHDSIDEVLRMGTQMGTTALQAAAVLVALAIIYKYIERRRLLKALGIPRISIEELKALIDGGHDPLIIDARGVTARQLDDAIPGALIYGECEPSQLMAALDKNRHVVVYCSCPNDVTAAKVAKEFLAHGFDRARPLEGGLDAWKRFAEWRRASSDEQAPGATQ